MKWYEFSVSHGDGTYGVMRFRSREEAQKTVDFLSEQDGWEGDGDGNPVKEVDTDSNYFFDSFEEATEDY